MCGHAAGAFRVLETLKEYMETNGIEANVVSMLCVEKFNSSESDYRAQILDESHLNVVIEAGTTFGWSDLLGVQCQAIGINRFGASAPGQIVASKLGLNVDNIVTQVTSALSNK